MSLPKHLRFSFLNITGNTNLEDNEVTFVQANPGGATTLTLPPIAETLIGQPLYVNNVHASNDVTIATPGAETVGGGATFTLQANTSVLLVSDVANTDWRVLQRNGADGGSINFNDVSQTVVFNSTATVTQATNNNTAVTANAKAGQITMQAAIGAGNSHTFVVNNDQVTADSAIFLSVLASTSNNIAPSYSVNAIVAATSFSIVITNQDGGAATAAAPIIHFWVTEQP